MSDMTVLPFDERPASIAVEAPVEFQSDEIYF